MNRLIIGVALLVGLSFMTSTAAGAIDKDSTTTAITVARVTPGQNGLLAFESFRGDNYDIFVMNTDGSNQTNLTNHPANDIGAKWSPDGRKIAFSSLRDRDIWEIYVMDADGSNVTRLTNNTADDLVTSWSPDASKLAFASDRDGHWEVYIMNADGSAQTALTEPPANNGSPAWSPDGKKIAFTSDRDGDCSPVYGCRSKIYVMNAYGSNPTKLTTTPTADGGPAWSPDGTKIAFETCCEGNPEIYVMNADGSDRTNLTNHPVGDGSVAWSPDGTKLAFMSYRTGEPEIFVMNADGSDQTDISNSGASDFGPNWQPLVRSTCMNDGWKVAVKTDGTPFRNQGDCIQFINTGR